MRNRLSLVALLCTMFACGIPGIVRADPVQLGVTLNGTIGYHEESSGRQTLPLIPAPVFDVRVPLRRFEFFGEGFPPVGPISYTPSSALDIRGTKISYALGSLRYILPDGRTKIGVGASLYNQLTTYSIPTGDAFGDVEVVTDQSRVGGLRWEILRTLVDRGDRRVEASLAVNPRMHADVNQAVSFSTPVPGLLLVPADGRSGAFPEDAAQVDARVTAFQRWHGVTLTYGVRYLNYAAAFTSGTLAGGIADRNRLILPFIGVDAPLGR